MSAWTKCPRCGLIHTPRSDGSCPRCRPPLAEPPPAATPPAKVRRFALGNVAGIVGAVIGIGLSKVFGMALLCPAGVGFGAAALLAKRGPERSRPFRPAASVVVGHLGWMAAGAVIAGTYAPVAVDVVLMAGGVAWLLLRPGLAPAIVLALFEVLSIAVNAVQLAAPENAGAWKPLALHILLRAFALAALGAGYVGFRKHARNLSAAALARAFE